MENAKKTIFSDKGIGYLSTVALLAKFIAILLIFQIGFMLYNFYHYYAIFTSGNMLSSVSYLTSSIMRTILLLASVFFLFQFSNKIEIAKRSTQIDDWNKAFTFLRNYLIALILLSFTWIFSTIFNFFL